MQANCRAKVSESISAKLLLLFLRAKNTPIVVPKSRKNGARIFSLWRENFLLPEPKAKKFRATSSGATNAKILARKQAQRR